MNEEFNPSDSVPGVDVNDVATSKGNENDSQIVEQAVSQGDNTLTLEEINQTLGRQYADKPTALKALKETVSYVGKLGQQVSDLKSKVESPVVPSDYSAEIAGLRSDLEETKFYNANPEYNTPEAKALISKFGGKPEEVVRDDIFKQAYNAIKTTSEIEKSKSVLQSNPRLGQVTDKLTQARDAMKAGDDSVAKISATQAVMEAFDIGK